LLRFGWHFRFCLVFALSLQRRRAEVISCRVTLSLAALRTNRLRIVLNLAAYYPVLLFLLVGTGLGVALVSIGKILGPNRPDTEKNAPYECGFEAFEDARMKFDVRYYLVAILFIIFDLETAFLFPWGVALRDIGWPGFMAMMIFLLEFLLGFAYIWKKGGLDWE
jgi:NADH-quinone oxidoreductase subunit A